jgi:hypothetical protein
VLGINERKPHTSTKVSSSAVPAPHPGSPSEKPRSLQPLTPGQNRELSIQARCASNQQEQ